MAYTQPDTHPLAHPMPIIAIGVHHLTTDQQIDAVTKLMPFPYSHALVSSLDINIETSISWVCLSRSILWFSNVWHNLHQIIKCITLVSLMSEFMTCRWQFYLCLWFTPEVTGHPLSCHLNWSILSEITWAEPIYRTSTCITRRLGA